LKKSDLEVIKKIKKYCEETRNTLSNVSYTDFNSGNQTYVDKRFACSLYLFQIGELSNKLSDEVKTEYAEYSWKGAYRLRNIIGHDYEVVGNKTIWDSCQYNSTILLNYVEKIIYDVARK